LLALAELAGDLLVGETCTRDHNDKSA
jgi:hypothetical protein